MDSKAESRILFYLPAKLIKIIFLIATICTLSYSNILAKTYSPVESCCNNIFVNIQSTGPCQWNISIQQTGSVETGCAPLVAMKIEDVGYILYPVTPFQAVVSVVGQSTGSGIFRITFYDSQQNSCVQDIPYNCEEDPEYCTPLCPGGAPYSSTQIYSQPVPGSSCISQIAYKTRNCGTIFDLQIESIKIIPIGCVTNLSETDLRTILIGSMLKDNGMGFTGPNSLNPDATWRISQPSSWNYNSSTGEYSPAPGSSCCIASVGAMYINDCGQSPWTALYDIYNPKTPSRCPSQDALIREYNLRMKEHFPY